MFNKGDFVRTNGGRVFVVVGKDGKRICNGEWDCYNDEPVSYSPKDLKIWKPIEDEWCWFYDMVDDEPFIAKYNSQLHMVYDCIEPFIGTLPKCIKDAK